MKRKKEEELYIALICGDRNAKKLYVRIVKREIQKLISKHGTAKLVILQGGAPGVDFISGRVAKSLNVHSIQVDALWETRHHSAGPQRNKVMALLKPNEVIGIHDNIDESVGTAGMLELAEKRGIKWRLVDK